MPDDPIALSASRPSDPEATIASLGPQLATAARDLPASIGSYRIIRLLGEGGIGGCMRPSRTGHGAVSHSR